MFLSRLQLEARLGITQPKSPTEVQPELPPPSQSLQQPSIQQPDDGKRKSARRKEYACFRGFSLAV